MGKQTTTNFAHKISVARNTVTALTRRNTAMKVANFFLVVAIKYLVVSHLEKR